MIVFGYTLCNAWGGVQNTVKVTDDREPCVVYSFSREGYGTAFGLLQEECRIGISLVNLEEIARLAVDERLYETETLEEPYGVMFLDGFSQEFEFGSGNKHVLASGSNIQACSGDDTHCPHSALMIRVLEKAKQILVPLGVPEECFRLSL